MNSEFIEKAVDLLKTIDEEEKDSIAAAGTLIADSIMAKGIIIAFGSGHSVVGAKELVQRAGGLFAAKRINDPSEGMFEVLPGTGELLMKRVEVKPEDVVFVISNSGRNPEGIEIALIAKEKGAKVVAVTGVQSSKQLTSKHASGKLLYQIADVVLDMHTPAGDAAIAVEGVEGNVCGISTITTAAILQASVLYAIKLMVKRGYTPPVRISKNLSEAAIKRSEEIEKNYADRVFRF
ncbi:MAG: sugar isomerase domain-containing protein [Erysipelotrichaceae bacterium]|nr:sugar isomerase domain-containing protein [Erysipelotrichaceae bacterium]